MTKTNNSPNTSNIFKKIKKKFHILKSENADITTSVLPSKKSEFVALSHASYYNPESTTLLFLSKRGLSRAPLAREIMRSLLHLSDHFGSIRPSARGISEAYEYCPFDRRMVLHAEKFGYVLSGHARRVNMGELSSANLIITLDKESEDYTKSRNFYTHGQVKPIRSFLSTGSSPYIEDPFDRENSAETTSNYQEIIRTMEYGCGKLLKSLSSFVWSS